MSPITQHNRTIGDGFVVIFVQDGDPVIYPDPDASIPEPSLVYDDIYEAAKNQWARI